MALSSVEFTEAEQFLLSYGSTIREWNTPSQLDLQADWKPRPFRALELLACFDTDFWTPLHVLACFMYAGSGHHSTPTEFFEYLHGRALTLARDLSSSTEFAQARVARARYELEHIQECGRGAPYKPEDPTTDQEAHLPGSVQVRRLDDEAVQLTQQVTQPEERMVEPHGYLDDLSFDEAEGRNPKLLGSLSNEIRHQVRSEVKREIELLSTMQQDQLAQQSQLEAAFASLQAQLRDATRASNFTRQRLQYSSYGTAPALYPPSTSTVEPALSCVRSGNKVDWSWLTHPVNPRTPSLPSIDSEPAPSSSKSKMTRFKSDGARDVPQGASCVIATDSHLPSTMNEPLPPAPETTSPEGNKLSTVQEAEERGFDSDGSDWFCVEPSNADRSTRGPPADIAHTPTASSAATDSDAFTPLPIQQSKGVWGHGTEYDRPALELVLNIVITCSAPEVPYPHNDKGTSKDGVRTEVWSIVGGRWDGHSPSTPTSKSNDWIGGKVVAGGADLPYIRPDGAEVVDAFYRLQADDGTVILLHNLGLTYPSKEGTEEKYRLAPTFTAPATGPYAWLNSHIFVGSLVDCPSHLALARPELDENDRLVQVYCVA